MTKSALTEEFRQGFMGHAIKMGIWTHKNCSPARLMFVIVAVIVLLLASHANTALALEFKSQAEKIAWIKNAIKGKKFKPNYKEADDAYYKGGYYTAEEKQFMREFLKDFLAQTNIEYIEPIATGDSVDDPAIAKFNTSCPDKKPMNVGLDPYFGVNPYTITDQMLEYVMRNKNNIMVINKCTKNFKVFKVDLFNTHDKQEYILYCDNATGTGINMYGEIVQADKDKSSGLYYHIFPNQCLYSREIWSVADATKRNVVLSIIRYRGVYYLCCVDVYPKVTGISIARWKRNIDSGRPYNYDAPNATEEKQE